MKRDNCGFGASDMIKFYNWDKSNRIRGYVILDIPLHSRNDFTTEMKGEMISAGYDFDDKNDRLTFISNSEYCDEWKKAPHYWVNHENIIHDPTGDIMFMPFMLQNLTNDRYVEDPNI